MYRPRISDAAWGLIWLVVAILLFMPTAVIGYGADVEVKTREMLYPMCRVTVDRSGGSGTILYSEDRSDGCQTFVLTNHHVVEAAIKVESRWSSLLQTDRKQEVNELVQVEIFRYAEGSRQDISDTCRAEIVAHDREHDLALLKLQTARRFEHVARLLPPEEKPAIFEPIWAVGCTLLHPPVVTEGVLNYLDDVIDRKVYWLGSAAICFGNSGGAVFLERSGHYYFIGVPSRMAVVGFSSPVTHMGYFAPICRIREWVKAERLEFLIDSAKKPVDCFREREELRKKAELQQLHISRSGPQEPMPAPPEARPKE